MLASNLMVVGILDNTCLFSVHISPNDVENKRKPVPDEVGNPNFKRIDPGSEIVICDSNTGDIYVIGNDKLFKKYELPNEAYGQLKWRTPPKDPIDEFFDHSIGVNTWDISDEQNYIATGGKDGLIKLRNRSRISASDDIKAHAIHNDGVTALCFSKFRAVLYSAGGDGQFLVWNIGSNPNPAQPIESNDPPQDDIVEVSNVPDAEAKNIKDILEEKFLQTEIP